MHFGVEFNFAGMPANAEDRYLYGSDGESLGHLGTELDLHDVDGLGLVDQWLGLDVRLAIAEYLHRELDSEAFRPPEILRKLVAEGRLGRKSGRGFYEW